MDKMRMLKKGGLVAIGLASLTAKKTDKIINQLIAKGKLSRKQGEDLARKVVGETKKEQKKMKVELQKSAQRVIRVTKEEANRLMKKRKVSKPKKKAAKKRKATRKKKAVRRKKR